jgi:hypothetical protein
MATFWDPTPDEVRNWAYSLDAAEPCEDWDLALVWTLPEKALLECASDERCPKREYMLRVLDLVISHAIRDGFRSRPKVVIEGFLTRGDQYAHLDIKAWQVRGRQILVAQHKS